jgi:hypothetical protein
MNEQSPFERRTREVLEESTARLDGRTRSRLTQARHAALESVSRPTRPAWRAFLPAGATAALAVLAVVVWSARPAEVPAPVAQGANAVEDMELLADAEVPDFFLEGEDLEFYEWAAGAGEVGS